MTRERKREFEYCVLCEVQLVLEQQLNFFLIINARLNHIDENHAKGIYFRFVFIVLIYTM